MIDAIAWIGSILLMFCAVPQLLKTLKSRKADDISWLMLVMWGFGDLLMFVWSVAQFNIPLSLNYGLNAACVLLISSVKLEQLGNSE